MRSDGKVRGNWNAAAWLRTVPGRYYKGDTYLIVYEGEKFCQLQPSEDGWIRIQVARGDDTAEGWIPESFAKFPDEAVYCKTCQIWLNGPRQFEDHERGKKHRNKLTGSSSSNDKAAYVAQAKRVSKSERQRSFSSLDDQSRDIVLAAHQISDGHFRVGEEWSIAIVEEDACASLS